tara:strand:- start:691 stop:1794 length:1104 start_codon:yes stop_codon:yes gene_type:complete
MKNLLSMLVLVVFSASSYAGGAMAGSHSGHNAMSSGKSSSGVHFYGRLYVGYDDVQSGSAADVEKLDDGGGKSRLGLKMTESLGSGLQLIGNLEYKFDPVDGTQTDTGDCTSTSESTSCRTFNLHIGNLGFKTGLGYIGVGTFESPYKTMGKFDNNMDTAIAMNAHGATSRGTFGQAGTMESMLTYHGHVGPAEIVYMVALSDDEATAATDRTNTDQGDYSLGIQFKDMFVHGLNVGYARNHDQSLNGASGESNDRFFASMKVLPNAGVFVSMEDLNISGSYISGSNSNGDITSIGTHYKLGHTAIQAVYAKGDSDGAATEDYKSMGISATMHLSKTSDITFGYIKRDFDSTGTDVTTRGIGLTHKF